MTRTAYLTPGQYSGSTLAEEVSKALTSAGSQTYTTTWDAISGKLSISAPATFRFEVAPSTARRVIGLTKDTSPVTSYTFSNPIDLSGASMLLCSIQEISTQGKVIMAGRESENVLDVIPVTSDYATIMTYVNHETDYIDCSDTVLSTISVRLLDSENLLPVDFRGNNYQIVLSII